MKIDEKNLKQIIEQLNRFLKKCNICANTQFQMADKIFTLPEYNHAAFDNKANYPVIVMTCTNCGNTYFLNAVHWGLVKP